MVSKTKDNKEGTSAKTPEKSKGSLKLILGAIVLVVVTAIVVAGVEHYMGGSTASQTGKTQQQKAPSPPKDDIFHALTPAFVVNIKGDRVRFLQIKLKVLTHDKSIVKALKKYSPIIRNNLVLLLRSQSYASLSLHPAKAQAKLRAEVLAAIQKVLKAKTGHKGVAAVYFTSFVIQ